VSSRQRFVGILLVLVVLLFYDRPILLLSRSLCAINNPRFFFLELMIQRFVRVYGNARFPILRENPDNLDLEISAVALSRFTTVPLVSRLHAHISSIVRASDSINERFPVTAGCPVYPSFQLG